HPVRFVGTRHTARVDTVGASLLTVRCCPGLVSRPLPGIPVAEVGVMDRAGLASERQGSARLVAVLTVAALLGGQRASVLAVCNLIPAAAQTFPSRLGEVTTPFGVPCPRGKESQCR